MDQSCLWLKKLILPDHFDFKSFWLIHFWCWLFWTGKWRVVRQYYLFLVKTTNPFSQCGFWWYHLNSILRSPLNFIVQVSISDLHWLPYQIAGKLNRTWHRWNTREYVMYHFLCRLCRNDSSYNGSLIFMEGGSSVLRYRLRERYFWVHPYPQIKRYSWVQRIG